MACELASNHPQGTSKLDANFFVLKQAMQKSSESRGAALHIAESTNPVDMQWL